MATARRTSGWLYSYRSRTQNSKSPARADGLIHRLSWAGNRKRPAQPVNKPGEPIQGGFGVPTGWLPDGLRVASGWLRPELLHSASFLLHFLPSRPKCPGPWPATPTFHENRLDECTVAPARSDQPRFIGVPPARRCCSARGRAKPKQAERVDDLKVIVLDIAPRLGPTQLGDLDR